ELLVIWEITLDVIYLEKALNIRD
ncbi:MAG: hypothetical protein K0S93_2311, partial [Nitrososphaeraceae archaeon]|nr:hypothetical protein [Nitrososphaeraceae archaeon]